MATSGYKQVDTSFGYVKLAWSESSQDITNNKTTISYTLSIYREYSISSSASKDYSIVINGSTVASGTTTIGGSGTKTIKSGTTTIAHNADGTKTFNYSFSQEIAITWGGSWIGTVTGSSSGTLDTIARATQPALPDAYIYCGDPMVINTPRASGSFTHTLRYAFGSSSGTIATGVATTYTWNVPLSLLNQIPNATSGNGTIYCDTYNGSTKIGTKTVAMYLYAKSDIVPSFTSVTHAETVSAVTTVGAGYLQGISKPKFTINGASGTYSSTITKYEFTFESITYTGNNATANAIKGSGSIVVTAKITDSRGRTASKTATLTVTAYASPKVNTLTVQRANSDGTLNDMGTSAKITRSVTFSSLGGKNSLTIVTKSRARGVTTWTTNNTTSAGTTGSYSTPLTLSTFDVTKSYDFQIEFTDKLNTTIVLSVLPTGLVTMSWGPAGIGIGKVWQGGALDIYGDVNVEGKLIVKAGSKIELPSSQYASSTAGSPFDVNNSDIIGLNSLYMSDTATSSSEAIQWKRTSTPAGSFVAGDHDSFRVLDGVGYLNDVPIFAQSQYELWTGGYYMNDAQTATPTKKLSECVNGWVLCWSDYNADTATINDSDMVLTFIHKRFVSTFSGKWMPICVPNYTTKIVIKYLGVYDDKLTGHSNNDSTTATGEIDAPTDVVLRKIWEW